MGELRAHGGLIIEHRINKTTILYAAIASIIIGGPLLGMMCFMFLATTILVLFAAPLMLLFSPTIIPAGFVLAALMIGFNVAIAMAFVEASALHWAYKSVGGVGRVMGMVRGSSGGEIGMDFGGYLEQKRRANEPRLWQS